MAVYTNDLRLKEIATGDESGTWGTSTNTNLSLIADAFGFGTEAITTNADTHTTTIADGSADPGRSIFLKYTGTLDSACTITIGPNTVSKLWLIENATSGSQNIIIKQGSGATVTIANGQTKAIYSDGAGSGGAMVDAFTDLSVPTLFVEGAADISGAITSSAGATITVADNSDNLSIVSTDADANIGPNIRFYRNSSSPADDDLVGGIVFDSRNDNSQDIQPVRIRVYTPDVSDGSEDSALDIATMTAGTLGNRLDILPTETIINNAGIDADFRVESDGSTHALFVQGSDGNVGIGTTPSVKLHVRGSAVSGATFNGDDGLTIEQAGGGGSNINLIASNNTGVLFSDAAARAVGLINYDHSGNSMRFNTNGSEAARIDSGGDVQARRARSNTAGEVALSVQPSDSTIQYGFRIDSSANSLNLDRADSGNEAHLISIASNGNVGIGESDNSGYLAPDLVVVAKAQNGGITVKSSSTSHAGTLAFADATSGTAAYDGFIQYEHNNRALTFGAANGERFRVNGTEFIVNDASGDIDFRAESNGNAHMLFVDAANDAVGIGVSDVADAKLVIQSTGVDGTYANVLSAQFSSNSNEHNVIATSVSSAASGSGFLFKASDGGGSTGTTEVLKLTRAGAIFNDASGDQDFRVESDSNANMLFVDAGNNRVFIDGSGSNISKFQSAQLGIQGNAAFRVFNISGTGANDTGISVNAGNVGMAMLVIGSRNTGAGTATASGMYLLNFAFNGNNTPTSTHIAGTDFLSFGQSAGNDLTITNAGSGNCTTFLMMFG